VWNRSLLRRILTIGFVGCVFRTMVMIVLLSGDSHIAILNLPA
jgi:hypothetical protein